MKTDIVQCQSCHGEGGTYDSGWNMPEDVRLFEECGYCQGTGHTTKMMNAWIMRWSPRFPDWSPSEEDIKLHEAAMRKEQENERTRHTNPANRNDYLP